MAQHESAPSPRGHAGTHDLDQDVEKPAIDALDDPQRAPGRRTLTDRLASVLADAIGDSGRERAATWLVENRGAGSALPSSLRRSLAPRLGDSLDDVRVHDDAIATAVVRALGVAAFTYGRDVFTAGPVSDDVLAHEAAHAAQHHGATPSGKVELGGEAHSEDFADRAAASRYTPLDVRVPFAAPRARFKGADGVDVVGVIAKEMGSDEEKAKTMLRNAAPEGRASVEQAVRKNFAAEKADELIKAVPAGGGAVPEKAKEPPQAKADGGGDKAGGDKGGGDKAGGDKGGGDKAGGKGGAPTGDAAGGGASPAGAKSEFEEISTSDLDLIHQELIEHERWKSAKDHVGGADSLERAAFIAESAGKGGKSGFGTGFLMGLAGGVVTKLATRYCPIPGVGAIIAGGFSAYALLTKDWSESFDTIGKFGEGNSTYEVLANSLASVSEVLDIVVNVLNVIAGIIGVISAIMWLVTICTLGAASPLAATLSSIALGIIAVTSIVDDLNKLMLQPLVLLFRALHTFTTDADPRDVEQQGEGISKAASEAAAAVGSKAGGAIGEKVGGIGEPKAGGGAGAADGDAEAPGGGGGDKANPDPGGKNPSAKGGSPDPSVKPDPNAPKAGPDPSVKPDPNAAKPDPNAPKPDPNAPKPDPNAKPDPKAEADAKAKAKQQAAEAKKKIEAEKKAAFEDLKGKYDLHKATVRDVEAKRAAETGKAREDGRAAKQKEVDAAREAAHKSADAELKTKLDEIAAKGQQGEADVKAQQDLRHKAETEASHKKHVEDIKAAGEAHRADNRAAADKLAADNAAADAKFQADSTSKDLDIKKSAIEEVNAKAKEEASKIEDPAERAFLDQQNAKWYAEQRLEIAKQELAVHQAAKKALVDEMAAAKKQHDQAIVDADARNAQALKDAAAAKDQRIESSAEQTQKAVDDHAAKVAADEAKAKADTDKSKADADTDAKGKSKDVDKAGDDAAAGKKKELDDKLKASENKVKDSWGKYKEKDPDLWKSDPQKSEVGKQTLEEWLKEQTGQTAPKTEDDKKKEEAEKKALEAAGKKAPTEYEAANAEHEQRFTPDNRQTQPRDTGLADGKSGYRNGKGKNFQIVKTERIDPGYADPPGTPEQLDVIKGKIMADLEVRAKAEADEHKMAVALATANNDKKKLEELEKKSKEGMDAQKAHKAATERKEGAAKEQEQRNAKASSTIGAGSDRLAGITVLAVPLAAFEGFTWIGAKLGSSSFQKMNQDAKKLRQHFTSLTKNVGVTDADTKREKAKHEADKAKLAGVKGKSDTAGGQLQKADADVKDTKAQQGEKVNEAKEAKGEANAVKGERGASAQQGKTEYQTLASALAGWAQAHQGQRKAAQEKQQAQQDTPGDFGSDLVPEGSDPNGPGDHNLPDPNGPVVV